LTWTWKFSKKELEDLARLGKLSAPIKTALEKETRKFGMDEKTRRISLLDHVLSPEFPEARLLNFCYNSTWFVNAPVATPSDFALKLLEELVRIRSNNQVLNEDSRGVLDIELADTPASQLQSSSSATALAASLSSK
jgi:hypothetical protein